MLDEELTQSGELLLSMINKLLDAGKEIQLVVTERNALSHINHVGYLDRVELMMVWSPITRVSTEQPRISYFESRTDTMSRWFTISQKAFEKLNLFRHGADWVLSDQTKYAYLDAIKGDEPIAEGKAFDSLVLSMIRKHLEQRKQINIAIDNHHGEIDTVDYWSDEGIVNIDYIKQPPDGGFPIRAGFRYRPLTAQMFDDNFTITKIGGISTVIRSKHELDEGKRKTASSQYELDEVGQMALNTIKKAMDAGMPVYFNVTGNFSTADGQLKSLLPKDEGMEAIVRINDDWQTKCWLDMDLINQLKLKTEIVDGVKTLQVTGIDPLTRLSQE